MAVKQAANLIKESKKVVALTGAGCSTRSGIPDFRSPGSGLWLKEDPFEVASLSAFRYQPQRFYEWFRPLAKLIFSSQPNPAHTALARLEAAGFIDTIITQNIDGLHQKSGSKNVLEVHGTLKTMTCLNCYFQDQTHKHLDAYLNNGTIPKCSHCNQILKPDVILMEEQLPINTWLKAEASAQNCEVMLIVGSSLVVMPVAGLPMKAVSNGAPLIIINNTKTYLDIRAEVVINEDVADIIPLIAQEVLGE